MRGGGAVTRETAVHIYDQLMLPIFKPWNWVWGGEIKMQWGGGEANLSNNISVNLFDSLIRFQRYVWYVGVHH